MKECSKSINRCLGDSRFLRNYFVGEGIDIDGKPDPLSLYQDFFPLMRSVRTWDLEDGDAQHLGGVLDEKYDFVHSSHCLEHLHDPAKGLKNWLRVLKPSGHLIITVPDEDSYEQDEFPCAFNHDHKWSFTVYKPASWSDKSINVINLLINLGEGTAIEKIELLDSNYRCLPPRYDQTLTPVGKCGIEIIIRRHSDEEIRRLGLKDYSGQPDKEMRAHLNKYHDDMITIKNSNQSVSPFTNDSDL